ncbi:HEAT repeat domain-containing protein [Eubacteriales bacterium OttesenSCG-928-M02]|nr:HEAT repeat domain-containing protein [Eubacteriales bacterium OttesenSCG-928-M02]
MKKILLGYVVFFAVLFAIFFGNRISLLYPDNSYKFKSDSGVQYVAKTEGKTFSIYEKSDGWRELFVTGVNLGAAKPGYFPGDFGITKKDYLRWFQHISDMNVNTIRVYVLQMPEFYQAFKEFNETSEKPLYLIHGVYINEADILKHQDAYAENGLIRNAFLGDIRNVVDVIHGNARIPKTAGNAGGTYAADVSQYVIGWIFGIEWEAEFVNTTNENNPEITSYDGEYVYAEDVTPFEVMLAEAADTAISHEMQQYNEQRPLAMSNWVTSDPLTHPGEPNPEVEDAISVDMNNLHAKDGFEAGFFASYHVYPYYPDLFNYDQELLQDDPPNSYRAYIKALNQHHSMPVLISEVGIPASRGIAHENIYSGYNQGHVTETEQGEILVSLMGDIYHEGLMGAVVFSWQDEWFKKTWNTQDMDVADHRAYWMDYQTNEQSFGLMAFEPGEKKSVVYVDGETSEWKEKDIIAAGDGVSLSMKSDEKFLYLMVQTDSFDKEALYLPIDTISGQGNTHYNGVSLGMEADFLLVLDGKDGSTMLVDPYYDVTYYEYAVRGIVMERNPDLERTDTGAFVPITLMLSRGIHVPDTGETIPYKTFDTGRLRYGIANPSLEGYDSIADFYAGDGVVEIRIPWLLLSISDPSSKQMIGDLYENEGIAHKPIESIGIGIYAQNTPQNIVRGSYSWQPWETPTYHERLKDSYAIVQNFYAGIKEAERPSRTGFELVWGRWNQAQFSNIGFWFPIQPMLNYAIAFLLSVIVYFFLVLLYIHAVTAVNSGNRRVLEGRICAAVEGQVPMVYSKRRQRYTVPGLRKPFSRNSLIIFASLMERSDIYEKERIREMMLAMGYEEYVTKQLGTRDMGYLILMLRMVGELRLEEQADNVKKMLYTHKNETDLQYQGLLTLSVLGAYDSIVSIAMDESFVQSLSFRSLQEIFKSFSGDKEMLYSALLDSPDTFIRRIAIKRIGAEGFTRLADRIIPYLDENNYNVVIDTARSLGQLKAQQAAPDIAELLTHTQWEVRAVAVAALASIDIVRWEKQVVLALSDPEWTVRNNAAAALSKTPYADRILLDVVESGDKYAFEVLKYMMETHGLWGETS